MASSAGGLAVEVERALASGNKLEKGGETYAKLDGALGRLREDNDRIIAEVIKLKEARVQHCQEEERLIQQLQGGEEVSTHGPCITDALKRIEDIDFQLAGLRCQQLENSRDVSVLKRGKVRIEKSEEVSSLVGQVEEALSHGQALGRHKELTEGLTALIASLREEFDSNSHAVLATKKEIDNSIAKLRTLELGRRVRRGRINAETEALGGNLVSSFYEAQRKNAKLMRLRDTQALNAKEINGLERVLDKLARHVRVRELISAGDHQQMEAEAAGLWEEIQKNQRALSDLEAVRARHAEEAASAITSLRSTGMKDVVTPATGELREKLIASLREEELCATRLAVLRGAQAQDVTSLMDLKAALKA